MAFFAYTSFSVLEVENLNRFMAVGEKTTQVSEDCLQFKTSRVHFCKAEILTQQ